MACNSYSLLSKVDWNKVKWMHRFVNEDQDGKLRLVKKPPFEIPLSILDVWYTQALMWWVPNYNIVHRWVYDVLSGSASFFALICH